MLSRRNFLVTGSVAAIAGQSLVQAKADNPRKRIAFLGTEVRTHSHAQHFLDRHAMG